MATYGIIFPVYNEEKRLVNGIEKVHKYISSLGIDFEFLIADNASTDKTAQIAKTLCERFSNVHYLGIPEKGVGIAFRSAVKQLNTDVIGYMDVDLSTDIRYFSDVVYYFENNSAFDMVNASRFNKKSITTGRKWYRNITSYGLILLLKLVFHMKASDAICGFKFFRKEPLLKLLSEASSENGWFFIIELLIRAERENMKIIELPVRWEDDAKHSKVNLIGTISNYITQIIKLRRALNIKKYD